MSAGGPDSTESLPWHVSDRQNLEQHSISSVHSAPFGRHDGSGVGGSDSTHE